MSNPAFIVDGFTEKLVIGSLCPGKKVSRTDLNGKSVTLDAMAIKISSLIRLLNNRHYPIIIVVDRENRSEDCEHLQNKLKEKITLLGINDQDIRIFFADRMFENWIIADWEVLDTELPKPEITDGLKGTSEIKKAIGSYNKTTDGVDLFLNCSLENVYRNSPSFRALVDSLQDIHCPFINLNQ